MFGIFKKKKRDIGFPSNELEQSILEARSNNKALETFYTKLLWADLIVLTDGSNPEECDENNISINFFALDSGHVPIFSSHNRIHDKGVIKKKVPSVSIKGQDLFEITKGAPLVLNPYSDYPKELLQEEINDLLNGTLYEKLKELEDELSPQEISELEALFNKAFTRQEKLVYLDGFQHKSLDIITKKKLQQSIDEFEQILVKCPDHWQSMFGMAKALQRLRKHSKALEMLEKAMEIESSNPALASEAAIEAVNLRNLDKALLYSEEAIRRSPDDHTLLGNHALNLLVAGKNQEAVESIKKALTINPNDQINKHISKIVNDVVNGDKKQPTFDELFWDKN